MSCCAPKIEKQSCCSSPSKDVNTDQNNDNCKAENKASNCCAAKNDNASQNDAETKRELIRKGYSQVSQSKLDEKQGLLWCF